MITLSVSYKTPHRVYVITSGYFQALHTVMWRYLKYKGSFCMLSKGICLHRILTAADLLHPTLFLLVFFSKSGERMAISRWWYPYLEMMSTSRNKMSKSRFDHVETSTTYLEITIARSGHPTSTSYLEIKIKIKFGVSTWSTVHNSGRCPIVFCITWICYYMATTLRAFTFVFIDGSHVIWHDWWWAQLWSGAIKM